jgi:Chromo (CHRromatin Organisation MOdifier) domain
MSLADPTNHTTQTAFRAIDEALRRENVARMEEGRMHFEEATLKNIIASRCDEWVEMRYVESRRHHQSQDQANPETHEPCAPQQSILDSKRVNGRVYYRVRWRGYPPEDDSWEPLTHIETPALIEQFHRRHPSHPGALNFSFGWGWWT